MRIEPGAVFHRPHLLVARREIEAADAGEGNGGGAHGAGFQRDEEVAVDQPLGAEDFRCGADRQQLGVRRGVLQFQGSVSGPGDDGARLVGHHRPHRHLATGGGGFGLAKGDFKGGWQIQSHRAN